jgi:hypothetical protein
MTPDPKGRNLMTHAYRTRSSRVQLPARGELPSTDNQGLVVLGKEILIQTFELDCSAGANPDPMLNHEVCQVLAIE